ncbi:MAG: DUF4145 domain-containing protein [Chlorobiota bacterium]
MNKELFLMNEFDSMEIPDWPCPSCERGVLKIDTSVKGKNNSIDIYDTNWTKEAIKHDEYQPDWDLTRFHGYLICSNCEDRITIYGNGRKKEEYLLNKAHYRDLLTPLNFNPPLNIIKINNECPIEIKNLIEDSFNLYWLDLSSCANKIRISIELILTQKKVKKTTINNRGKRIPLNLQNRIDIFKNKNEKIAEKLTAIKWIGNIGSHHGEITKNKILKAYEILEIVLNDIYDNSTKRINKSIKIINDSKGKKIV